MFGFKPFFCRLVTMDKGSPTPIPIPRLGTQNKKLRQKQCQLAIETCQC
jgi:hypothetical protein